MMMNWNEKCVYGGALSWWIMRQKKIFGENGATDPDYLEDKKNKHNIDLKMMIGEEWSEGGGKEEIN